MKTLIILLSFLCNYTLPEVSASALTSREMALIQGADTVNANGLRVRPFDREIIPPSSGVQFYRDGIIYLSHSKVDEKVPEHHLSFGSVKTYASLISDTIPGNFLPFELNSTTLFPSEATTFSGDFNTMYLSLIPEKSSSEKIFRARRTSNEWKIEEKPLEICNDNYIYSHPCLSADGAFMVFSSDQSGTNGGLDLWITRKEGEKWSKPENLGKLINSSGNELFAALDSKNNIYFSSDGHPGKGGYDIFVARYNGSAWDKPQVLPDPINTKDDELAYTIDKTDSKTAFYTKRSRSGKPRAQLYIVDINQRQGHKESLSPDNYFPAQTKLTASVTKEKEGPLPETYIAKKETASPDKAVQPATAAQVKKEETPGKAETPAQVKKEATPAPSTATSAAATQAKATPTTATPSAGAQAKATPTTATQAKATPTTTPAAATPTAATPAATTSADAKKETAAETRQAPASSSAEVTKDKAVYRVQITASTRPVGSQNITVAGKSYKSFEYLHQGGYRTTIGECATLAEASRLQTTCRQNGYSQAFVVAFVNNVRSTDPKLFK